MSSLGAAHGTGTIVPWQQKTLITEHIVGRSRHTILNRSTFRGGW